MIVDEHTPDANGDDHIADAVGTTGLFCNVIAVIASALSVVGFVHADAGDATRAAIVAGLSFAISMVCLRIGARRAAMAGDTLLATGTGET
jgi:hypothetical protein